jgi:hypothetical protein
MKKNILTLLIFSLFLTTNSVFAKDDPLKGALDWEVLSGLDTKTGKIKGELKKIINKKNKIPGFIVPLAYKDKELSEFLLLPYIPSCMHVPPPGTNQIIHVQMKGGKKFKNSMYPVVVTGILKVSGEKSKKVKSEMMPLPEASFHLTAENIIVLE